MTEIETKFYKTGVDGLLICNLATPAKPSWFVIHTDSNLPVFPSFRLKKQAKGFAESIGGMFDWTQPVTQMDLDEIPEFCLIAREETIEEKS